MQYIPFAAVLSGGLLCLIGLLTGLFLTYRMGGWKVMLQLTPQGHWSQARRLVWSGAIGFVFFNCLFTLLTWIPGALPGR